MARKTIQVAAVREKANHILAHSKDDMPLQRLGVAHMLEQILHMTDQYKGYTYLDMDHTTYPPTIPDETRRVYL
jgi:hypothetical protein